jgi:hypothetical protein
MKELSGLKPDGGDFMNGSREAPMDARGIILQTGI